MEVIDIIGAGSAVCIDTEVGRVVSFGACDASQAGAQGGKAATAGTLEAINAFVTIMCGLVQCTGVTVDGGDFVHWGGGHVCDWVRAGWVGAVMEGKDVDPIKHPTAYGVWSALSSTSTLELARKSYLFSIMCACLPGLVHNLKKLREIECWKAYCYQKMVPAGIPKGECETQYNYQICVYWNGQWTVFADILMSPLKAILNMINNPIAAAWALTKWAFEATCVSSVTAACAAGAGACSLVWIDCITYSTMQLTEDVLDLLQIDATLTAMQWESQMNFCDDLD